MECMLPMGFSGAWEQVTLSILSNSVYSEVTYLILSFIATTMVEVF